MSAAWLPVLPVVAPLLAAPLWLVVRRPQVAWWGSMAVGAVAFAAAAALLVTVLRNGPVDYAFGGWPPPIGIAYRIDLLGAFVLVLVSGVSWVVSWAGGRGVEREVDEPRRALFFSAYLLCLAGLSGMVLTGDLFNLFVFLEISSLSTYVLVAAGRDRRALPASFRYLIMGTVGATFVLIGIGLLYAGTGTLNMADLAARLPEAFDRRAVHTGIVFLIVGIAIKAALFPLHHWLPDAYARAPGVVSAFLAATATKVAIYVFIRVVFFVFGAQATLEALAVQHTLTALAAAAVVFGSWAALRQDDTKRLLAYSSVAQIGYIVLGLMLADVAGLQAGLTHLFNHALMKGALFLALVAVVYHGGGQRLSDLAGLGARMPLTAAVIVIGGLSLIGVPLTAGFVGKWLLVEAAAAKGAWWLIAVVVVGSVFALGYVGRMLEALYFRAPAAQGGAGIAEAPLGLLVPALVLAAANLYFGIDTRLSAGLAGRVAAALGGAG
ncbi:MAG: cation:proton antiporter [Gammaproteobacteria bacterium]|nr:MAG: cation:proton antiporter [Gammaproteobacteria bacterium]